MRAVDIIFIHYNIHTLARLIIFRRVSALILSHRDLEHKCWIDGNYGVWCDNDDRIL